MSDLTAGSGCRHPQTAELCCTLGNHCYSLFLFTERDGVAATNNAAEQSLRRAMIFCKLCFGTKLASGPEAVRELTSYIRYYNHSSQCLFDLCA